MSVDVQLRSSSKATHPGQRIRMPCHHGNKELKKSNEPKARSAPPDGGEMSNLPVSTLPAIICRRNASPSRYGFAPKIYARYPAAKPVCVEEKQPIFNPEPVPFATGELRYSTVLKKVAVNRKLPNGSIPCGFYCSPDLLSRTKGYFVRPGRSKCKETRSSKSATNGSSSAEVTSFSFTSSNRKAPFFHASRALFTNPPGSYQMEPQRGTPAERAECEVKNKDGIPVSVSPLNSSDDLQLDQRKPTSGPLHEATDIYWPPPPPPVSVDVTLVSIYNRPKN